MQRYVCILNGSGGQGKSTFASDCRDYLENLNEDAKIKSPACYELSTIDWPKEVAQSAGWSVNSKTEKDRKLLSDFKIALEEWDNSPALRVVYNMLNYSFVLYKRDILFFVNCREPHNIDNFKHIMDTIFKWPYCTVLVKNPRVSDIITNVADAGVYDYSYDYTIINDGTREDLTNKAIRFCNDVVLNAWGKSKDDYQ